MLLFRCLKLSPEWLLNKMHNNQCICHVYTESCACHATHLATRLATRLASSLRSTDVSIHDICPGRGGRLTAHLPGIDVTGRNTKTNWQISVCVSKCVCLCVNVCVMWQPYGATTTVFSRLLPAPYINHIRVFWCRFIKKTRVLTAPVY